jgi:pimeloyl-ACP methyl ester carboxylesterase
MLVTALEESPAVLIVRTTATFSDTVRRFAASALALLVLSANAAPTAASEPATPVAAPEAAEPFYEAPAEVPAKPGVLVRSEPYTRGVPAGARAWRILYTTTLGDYVPALASGIVVAAFDLPEGPRPVIAWTHGTTGVAAQCAPSAMPRSLDAGGFPESALDDVVAEGWVLVATDYAGLGTGGPVPFMIGEGQARSALDAVRAARQLADLDLDRRTVVWGHSQGGHAALWTAIVAPHYAPDIDLLGVAAMAPPTDLVALAKRLQRSVPGQAALALLATAYTEMYPDVVFEEIVRPNATDVARRMASLCVGPESLDELVVATASLQSSGVLAASPDSGALGERLRENSVTGEIGVPLLVAQGQSDPVIAAAETAAWVAERCATGQELEYRTYGGRDHMGLVAADSPWTAYLLGWTRDRFEGKAPASGCRTFEG